MMITRKHISRRTILRGLGTGIALPLLDAMIPALTAQTRTAAKPVKRLGVIYQGNGMEMNRWTPAATGDAFELTPILGPLQPFKDRLVVLSGLDAREGEAAPGEGVGDHSRAPAVFLTGVRVKKTDGADVYAGTSMDQIVAKELANETELASLEMQLDLNEMLGTCDAGYSCAYKHTISWRTPTTPNMMENDPRAIFERLFGSIASTDPAARTSEWARQRSLLDFVMDRVASLRSGLGPADTRKLTEYLDAVRDVERRIQRAEQQSSRELTVAARPAGTPDSYEEHARLIFDLWLLAYQCDLTRVVTFMMSQEFVSRPYPQIGVPDGHHAVSHHQHNPEKLGKFAAINTYHMKLFAEFLERLRATPDGDGSLLDRSLILYGSGLSDGDIHSHVNLPIFVVGGPAGKGGRHVRYAQGTPLSNLHLSLIEKMGVAIDTFGNSTGRLDLLSGV